MSIQWAIVAAFLYAEIAVTLLLILPITSPKRWKAIFGSRFINVLRAQSRIYFYILLVLLSLLLLDAIKDMRKYSNTDSLKKDYSGHLDTELQIHMKLFRAQRNFYISSFALFLAFVIRRLVMLISSLATMEAQKEAAIKQAAGASLAAKDLMSFGEMSAQNTSNEAHDKEVAKLRAELSALQKELDTERRDKEAMKKQSEALNTEYDRLSEEYNKLEKKIAIRSSGDKKDD